MYCARCYQKTMQHWFWRWIPGSATPSSLPRTSPEKAGFTTNMGTECKSYDCSLSVPLGDFACRTNRATGHTREHEGRQSYCDRNVKGREELALASPT